MITSSSVCEITSSSLQVFHQDLMICPSFSFYESAKCDNVFEYLLSGYVFTIGNKEIIHSRKGFSLPICLGRGSLLLFLSCLLFCENTDRVLVRCVTM